MMICRLGLRVHGNRKWRPWLWWREEVVSVSLIAEMEAEEIKRKDWLEMDERKMRLMGFG